MPEQKDIKQDLDTLLSDQFTAEERQTLQLFLKVASGNRIEEGVVTKKSPIMPPKVCEPKKLLETSGIAATGTNGTVRLLLTQFTCFEPASFETPIHVVATPLGSQPAFLTLTHSLVMDPTNAFGIDVEIHVFTWDANGAAAPRIPFDWFCRVAITDRIF